MHYYQHHIGDFIKATSRLTDSQVMAYLRLIWLYYDKDGVVKNDPEQICFEIGSDPKTIQMIIKTYFEVEGDYLRHSRCDKELQGYLNKSEGGKKGAERRWKNRDTHSLPIANPMPPQSDPNANQEPITKNHKPSINTPEGVSESLWKDFKKVRDKKKAPITETALKGLQREAQKANLTLSQVLEMCCERGWSGFKAEWVKDQDKPAQNNDKAWMYSDQGIIGKANELGIHSIGLTYQQLKEKCLLVMAKRAME